VTESNREAADRGYEAGMVAARLAQHDAHFAEINGSINRMVGEMHSLVLAVQRLGDQATADAATVITTAEALKAADQARRDQAELTWTPFQRAMAVVGAVAAVVVILAAFGVFR
jgi:hypothetical protein